MRRNYPGQPNKIKTNITNAKNIDKHVNGINVKKEESHFYS